MTNVGVRGSRVTSARDIYHRQGQLNTSCLGDHQERIFKDDLRAWNADSDSCRSYPNPAKPRVWRVWRVPGRYARNMVGKFPNISTWVI